MKISFLLILLLTFRCSTAFSQFEFPNDPKFRHLFRSTFKQIDKKFHLEKSSDFEFRLWANDWLSGRTDLFLLTNKNNKWSARAFRQVKGNTTEENISSQHVDSLWIDLMKNNLLTIRGSELLRDSGGNYIPTAVTDGVIYVFELKTKSSKRRYLYSNPEAYLNGYSYIKEYQYVVNLIELIYKFCGLEKDE